MIEKIKRYLRETQVELAKVTWPTKEELIGSTMVTILVSMVLGLFIFVVDLGLSQVMRVILGF